MTRPIPRAVLLSALTAWAAAAAGQASRSEHEKHHPEGGGSAARAAGGGMSGGGMSGGMGEMMEGMGTAPPKELFPSLLEGGPPTPQRRAELEQAARERMAAGAARISGAAAAFEEAAEAEDAAAMRRALGEMRAGLDQLESGAAARSALDDAGAARSAALGWFKREMDLAPPPPRAGHGPFGLSWFHFSVMILLAGFAAAMIGMYYSKMRRAADLLQALTGTPGTVASALPPPAADAPPAGDDADGRWSGRLRVARIFQETPDVRTFRLMNPLGGVLPFTFLPGQFLTVAAPAGDKPVRRGYTIASSPTQRDYAEITVKHEPGGVVSGYLHGRVKEGDLLDCSGPSGSFVFTGRECKCVLLIGGGVGITPLMSVIRYLTDRAWPGDVYLVYGVHAPGDVIFREELGYLQRRHPNFRAVVTVSHPEGTDWAGETGRISKDLIARSVPDLPSRYVHLCGPVPLMEAVRRDLADLGVPAGRIKTEAFGPALGRPVPAVAASPAAAEGAVALPTVTFARSRKSGPLPPDVPILDVADRIGVQIDNSCRVGTCGLCRVKLLGGTVAMAVEDGLEPGDKEKNIILACQAKATADVSVEA